jgi:hypothetical protein
MCDYVNLKQRVWMRGGSDSGLRFRAADCEAITDELSFVDWHSLFSRKGVDLCVDLFMML